METQETTREQLMTTIETLQMEIEKLKETEVKRSEGDKLRAGSDAKYHLDDIKDLQEILDIEKLSRLLEQFYRATGLANFIVDLKGNILYGVGSKSIYTEFYRKNKISSERCINSDTILADQVEKKEKYSINICQNGMVDVAFPIIIYRVHVATLFIGQFFFKTPDKDFFIKRAEDLGFNKEKYAQAFEECHVYDKETVLRFADYFSGLTNMLGELAQKTIDQKKRATELVIADKELAFQSGEKADRAAELIIADKELAFQSEEKADRAAELVIANKELVFQNEEKDKRAAELIIANTELAFQNEEKDKRAAELMIANKELAFQNKEKLKRAKQTDVLKGQNIELAMQKKLLAEASQHKSSFLSNMSHEMRTPLNAIIGFSELALKTSLTPKQHNYLNKIQTSSHTLLGLISDVLDLSKIEAGKLELEIANFNLVEVLQNVVNQVSTKSNEKGLELKISIDENVPISLNGDSLRLGQILLNLASNAAKFTDKGEIVIRVELLKNDGANASLQFSVKDTGIGLTKAQIENLFQPFTQADTSTTRKYGGTGLGLSISQMLVSLMNGDIWAESEKGVGSTFFFTVKINVADKERFGQYNNSFEKWSKRVLVVDDKKESREIIGSMLADMSLNFTMSASGEGAIAILEKTNEENRYDLVIMDWKMPGMDGIETSKRIKRMFASGKAPAIIILTAYRSAEVQEKAKKSGLEVVLYKPVTSSLLLNTIMYILGKDVFEHIGPKSEEINNSEYLTQFRGTRILLVEDNEINQEVAREILQEAGMTVTIANNGREAVDEVKTNPYDIVLMDIQMPIMDGYDAAREIRKDPAFAELPIISMTANALLSDQEKCLQAGMNDHVSKPIDTTQLFQKIAYWVKQEPGYGIPENGLFDELKQPSAKEEILTKNVDGVFDLAGFDVKTSLIRLGGNQNLYRKLLMKFYKNHKNEILEIRQALEDDDVPAAERRAHTIKGAAGNLGAQEVSMAASALEIEFRVNNLDNAEPLIARLEQALEQAFTSISLSEENDEETPAIKPNGEEVSSLMPLLEKLAKLLGDNDMAARECLEEILSKAKITALYDQAVEMKSFIDQYDFEGALGVLKDLLNIIRVVNNNGNGH